MASWMIHLRVADALLSKLKGITLTEFVMGNMAPDSGIPNADWSDFSPSPVISHFKELDETGHKRINIEKYLGRYFTKEIQRGCNEKQYSFYLGYLSHLLTDILWVKTVFSICAQKSPEEYKADSKGIIWKWKKDFYDLDALYLRENPDFRAFCIYENAVGFKNEYMDIFSSDAFEQRRKYITAFYRAERKDLDREYFYLTQSEAEKFVSFAAGEIEQRIKEYTES